MIEALRHSAGSRAGMIVRRASWHAAILVLVVSCAASLVTWRTSVHALHALRRAFNPDQHFATLREHFGDVPSAAYFTDRPDPETGLPRVFSAQYALVPTAISTDSLRELRRKLFKGYALVLDYADGALLARTLRDLRELCRDHVGLEVTRLANGVCLVRTQVP